MSVKLITYEEFDESKARSYRQKPVVVRAYKLDEDCQVKTLEGVLNARKGDYLVKGIRGEIYVCNSSTFKGAYGSI